MNENYGYGCNYILGQLKRFDIYGISYDNNLYDIISRDPDYVIKTLLYTAQGYFGTQNQYEVIMYMLNGIKYFPSNIAVPIRQAISTNWEYIVTDDFYRVLIANLNSTIHPGTEDIEKMLMGLNYDRIYEIYEWDTNFDNIKFILGFLNSISYDMLNLYTSGFFVDEYQLRTYLIEEMNYETNNIREVYIPHSLYSRSLTNEIDDPFKYIEFSTILYNIIASGNIDNLSNYIIDHMGYIYNKYTGLSFNEEPFKDAIVTKMSAYILELMYDLFESVIEYLIVSPNKSPISPLYYEEHKLNVGKAIRILTLPITETGVYHVM